MHVMWKNLFLMFPPHNILNVFSFDGSKGLHVYLGVTVNGRRDLPLLCEETSPTVEDSSDTSETLMFSF